MGLSSSSLWVKCCFLDVMLLKLTLSYFPGSQFGGENHFKGSVYVIFAHFGVN